jgi:hypothetical protein
MLEGLD